MTEGYSAGFPHSDIVGYNGWLPPYRRFSQAPTSFIASSCQGIHRVRLVTWSYNPKPPDLPFFRNSALDRSFATVTYLRMLPLSHSRSALICEKIASSVQLRFNPACFGRLIHVLYSLKNLCWQPNLPHSCCIGMNAHLFESFWLTLGGAAKPHLTNTNRYEHDAPYLLR